MNLEYECHITCYLKDAEVAQRVATVRHWTTSEIERDPLLGKDSYFYLTTHDNDIQRMFRRLNEASYELRRYGVEPVREKIELIIHDTKKKLMLPINTNEVPNAVASDQMVKQHEWNSGDLMNAMMRDGVGS